MQNNIDYIEKYEYKVKAFVDGTFDKNRILEDNLRVQSIKNYLLPLKGILLGVKDIINVNCFPTRCGSSLPYDLFVGSQASCVTDLLNAGAIFAGKTITAEFAVSDPGETRNPRNLKHTPGGSSSGSGAAIAAGFCDIAIGTQTCGSVIRPAGYCGVIGYKPSFGRIKKDGILRFSRSMDHVGLFAKNMNLLGKTLPIIVKNWNFQKCIHEKKIKIGIPEGSYLDLANNNISEQFYKTIKTLEKKFNFKRLQFIKNITDYNDTLDQITFAELYRVHSVWFEEYKILYRPLSRQTIELGKNIEDKELVILLNKAQKAQRYVQSLMIDENIDLWIAPVAPDLAPEGIESTGDFRMNSIWSYTGLPVITIPTGVNKSNLPYSIQIVGRFGEDENLLQFATNIQNFLSIKPLLNEWELV